MNQETHCPAELEELVQANQFRFGAEDIDYLRARRIFTDDFEATTDPVGYPAELA